jgi:hypothetical protein
MRQLYKLKRDANKSFGGKDEGENSLEDSKGK